MVNSPRVGKLADCARARLGMKALNTLAPVATPIARMKVLRFTIFSTFFAGEQVAASRSLANQSPIGTPRGVRYFPSKTIGCNFLNML
jgi:hypothetical protein